MRTRSTDRSIWIVRYYDQVSQELPDQPGERPEIETYARQLGAFLADIRDRICGRAGPSTEVDDARANFAVYLVAHSMGGLITRCFLSHRIGWVGPEDLALPILRHLPKCATNHLLKQAGTYLARTMVPALSTDEADGITQLHQDVGILDSARDVIGPALGHQAHGPAEDFSRTSLWQPFHNHSKPKGRHGANLLTDGLDEFRLD